LEQQIASKIRRKPRHRQFELEDDNLELLAFSEAAVPAVPPQTPEISQSG
jgi:hypothetical protein